MEEMELNNGITMEAAESVAEMLPVTTSRPTDHLICFGMGVLGGVAYNLVLQPVGKKVWSGLRTLTAKKPAEAPAPADTEAKTEESTDTPDENE